MRHESSNAAVGFPEKTDVVVRKRITGGRCGVTLKISKSYRRVYVWVRRRHTCASDQPLSISGRRTVD